MKFIRIGLLIVLSLGLFLRLFGYNWDQGSHLHPDERFLTMVGVDTKLPRTFSGYMNPKTSSFNPANKGFTFYVYGTLPVLMNKILGELWYSDTYETFHLQGRILSGLADLCIVLIIYKICVLLEKKLKFNPSIKLFAAFFYAIAVLPIQLSHFFTVDTFLNLFCWSSLYFIIKLIVEKGRNFIVYMSLSGLFLGLSFACKISALYFAPLIGAFVLMAIQNAIHTNRGDGFRAWLAIFMGMVGFILFSYFALRLGSPYYFETGAILDPRISFKFINNILELKSFDNPLGYFPPSIQWVSKQPVFQLINIFYFGIGPFYSLFSMVGVVHLFFRKKDSVMTISAIWIVLFVAFQSFQFAKTMRYLIFIYPFLALFAAIGLERTLFAIRHIKYPIIICIHVLICLSILIWPLAFFSIYTKDHSRVEASMWIYEHIPSKSILLSEYWDDPLPIPIGNIIYKKYRNLEVHVFDPDTKEKWEVINAQLNEANYYIMSSNRGWGSIPTVSKRYPMTTKFYEDMFKGRINYTLVKEFSSYPSLRYLGIPLDFPDQWAEEAFTVYDHPLVKIFKKNTK